MSDQQARPMAPGDYLTKRRRAAGLTLREAAVALAALRPGVGAPIAAMLPDRARMLGQAEADINPLAPRDIALLDHIYPVDLETYEALLCLKHGAVVPEPSLCPRCAARWSEPCACGRRPISVGITDRWVGVDLATGDRP